MAENGRLVLGIDIGTTSVKVCLLDPELNKVVASQTKDTQANVPSELGYEGHKQNAPKILSALHACVSRLPRNLTKQVGMIGVCGQMHGVMFWQYEDDAPWIRSDDSNRLEIDAGAVSSLYTWQDSRCDPDFLSTLPKPSNGSTLASGFGTATIFWFHRNRVEKLEKYNCAGTIQDFTVAMLCNIDRPIMSVQNASGWGYYNPEAKDWERDLLEAADFPMIFLPQIVSSGTKAGLLSDTWNGIPANVPVMAALGDLQCSVLSVLHHPDDAVLNISTSAQLAFVLPPTSSIHRPEGTETLIEDWPFFEDNHLVVASTLNGGNALATFITMLQHWMLDLGHNIPQSTLWDKCIELAGKCETSDLKVTPTLIGERYDPKARASVTNITLGNLSLGQAFKSACTGIIENLHRLMPRELLLENNISRILGTGSAISKNHILQEEVKNIFQLPIVYESNDAALGAAMAASKYMTS
ncbi:FGGY family of carbohydrate kinases, N-terminal domain [Nesidiocoris tenuis]|uniref:FGGY family of carbohydrate kinases, N-terminal domain n=1 Tax=Nesidiocoris tenuis TaxID=355587 RepID=A0ABN7BFB6_9HEMI|nr:FGGY family of carbohydrate kinases, N-terminal domain [Nesidiocoris tenuis]